MLDHEQYITRVEMELSMGWTNEHPELFRDSVVKFFNKYPNQDWSITARMTGWSYVFCAERRHRS